MQSTELLLACHGCEQKFPLRHLGYRKEEKRLLCSACAHGGQRAGTASLRLGGLEKTGPRMRCGEDLVRYICGSCRFTFSRSPAFALSQCPYCASTHLLVDAAARQRTERERLLDTLYG